MEKLPTSHSSTSPAGREPASTGPVPAEPVASTTGTGPSASGPRTNPAAAEPASGRPNPLGGLSAKNTPFTQPVTDDAGETVDPSSVYVQVGGEQTFRRLVAAFYRGVASDPEFRAMYPEEDLGPAEERLRLFLVQYFGGPTTYSQRRGHPRLRMRHVPFTIDRAARETWLRHMRAAMDEIALPPLYDELMWDYFQRAATAMINAPG